MNISKIIKASGVAIAATIALAPAPAAAQCRDPWVTQAVRQVMGRAPVGSGETGECNIRNYGGGSWSSYDDLVGKVRAAFGRSIAAPSGLTTGNQPRIDPTRINPGQLIGLDGSTAVPRPPR